MKFQFRKQESHTEQERLVNMEDATLAHFCVSPKNCRPKIIKNGFIIFFQIGTDSVRQQSRHH